MPSKKRGDVRPPGQIRQSQIVTTFGPGAMVDLPDYAVIIGGLDHWTGYRERQIFEDRLAGKVRALLRWEKVEFFAPPADRDDPTADITGITAWLFPEWFVAHYEERNERTSVRSRPLIHRRDLVAGLRYERDRRKYKVVPVRSFKPALVVMSATLTGVCSRTGLVIPARATSGWRRGERAAT